MNGKCFEIGTIQAFLDGETAPELTTRITEHVSACDACATKLAEADDENSVVFSALDREFNTLVPTQRLWTRINDTISVEKSRTSYWQRILAAFPLGSPSFAAVVGIVVMVGLFALVNGIRNEDLSEVAAGDSVASPVVSTISSVERPVSAVEKNEFAASSISPVQASVKESNIPASRIRNAIVEARFVENRERPRVEDAVSASQAYLPGEVSYVRTISELKQSVDEQKDRVMAPSGRIAYERDMAVVNDSIKRMQAVVRSNPRNQAAKQVLYSAYQDKIDLLNSVAQREEMMASLR